MMTSYFNLLKYAQSGIASPDMTYYDKLRASTLMGGVVQTLTGQPPLSFKSDGSPLISLIMKGNSQQSGTPSHDSIIMPTFCGVRTWNLWDSGDVTIALHERYISIPLSLEQGVYTLSFEYKSENTGTVTVIFYNESTIIQSFNVTITNDKGTTSITSTQPITAIRLYSASGYTLSYDYTAEYTNIMLNAGSTAMPYEPYGWSEKITCAGQTTPVYLGEVPTVRRVKKLVLDGTEGWSPETTNVFTTYVTMPKEGYKDLICTHYGLAASYSDLVSKNNVCAVSKRPALFIKDSRFTTSADFKAYLAAQYASGTPVTVWYVLANEETAIVNEPLARIGDYADELSIEDATVMIPTVKGQNTLTVDTTLQPSEMTITFKG